MTWKVVVAPGPDDEPVSLDQAKAHLRVDLDVDDDYISDLIVAAREHVEGFVHRTLAHQTRELVLDSFPCGGMSLLFPPVLDVLEVRYVSTSGASVVAPLDSFDVDLDSEPGRVLPVYGTSWPLVQPGINKVRVRVECGYEEGQAPSRALIHAMLLLIGHWYENREQVVVGAAPVELPAGVSALLLPHIVHGG